MSITSFQEQIHDLEIKLKESEKAACHVTLLEARVERIQNELSEAHKQLLDKQVGCLIDKSNTSHPLNPQLLEGHFA